MFGADATMQAWYDSPEQAANKMYDRNSADSDKNNIDYLFPKLTIQQPWLTANLDGNHVGEDFILIAEFSEQEGPRPVIVIPKDGGKHFDKNEFSVKILSVDHQSSFVEGCHLTEDAQVVMADAERQVHAFVHHIVLNDFQARGYVRPFCISYVTSDQRKLMACYDELSQQMKKVSSFMKYGNRLVFMRDLEKHQEDLSYTKARLLITQSYMTTSTPQGDNDLLNVLNALRQNMEEVKDILSKLKPLLNDHELEERFHNFEKLLKISVSNRRHSSQESSSLKDFDHQTSREDSSYGSFTETLSPEFSLYNKSKDQKPKFLDVSIIKGKRRFDRSLRGLHELCSWGAKEGLQRLRLIREFFKRDLSSIEIDDVDASLLTSDSGVLSFGTDCIGAKFSSSKSSMKGMGWKKSCCRHDSQDNLISLGSADSFKSLSSSFQSIVDEEEMFSARSSTIDNQSNGDGINFLSRSENADVEQENREDISNCLTHCFRTKMNEPHNVDELDTTLDVTLADGLPETLKQSNAAVDGRPRTSTTNSEFDVIEFDNDVKCTSRGCGCSKESNIGSSFSGKYKKVVGNGMAGRMRNTDSSEMLDLGNTTVTIEENSPFCDYYVKSSEVSNIDRAHESDDSVKVTGECQRENIDIPNVDSYSQFSKDVRNENDAETLKIEKSDSDNKCIEGCGSLSGMLEGITESFQPHAKYSINEMSSDFIEECSAKVLDTDKEKSDYHKECTQNIPADVINTCSDTRCETLTDFHDGQMERSEHQSSSSDSPGSLKMVFLPHTEFSINEVASDLIEDCSIKCQMNETNTRNELGAVQSENKAISDFIGDNDDSQTKAIERNYDKGKSASSTGLHDLNAAAESDKIKERIGLINGLWKRDTSRTSNNITVSSTEPSSEEETKHKLIRKKWRLSHPLKDPSNSSQFQDHGLLKVLTSYNNLQHVIYSLLSGRPVIVIGTRRHEAILKELLQALNVFVPVVPGCDHVSLLCQIKQLKVVNIHKFLLRGIIRSERKSLDYIVPPSLRRYITLLDVEKSLISCIPYQGSLLNFVSAIYNKKKVFKSEQALHTFIQMCLMEISTRAFSFYHCMCIPDVAANCQGVTLSKKSSMLELSADKYLSKAGLLNADSRIVKHLAEIVKIQQIDEEFKCRSLTDCPVYPFAVTYNTVHTFRC